MSTYRFGARARPLSEPEFRFDSDSGVITRADDSVQGQVKWQQARVMLTMLLSNPRRIYTAKELLREAWGAENVHVDEKAVREHLTHARHALGDKSGDIIQNVRGKGYFADVQSLEIGNEQLFALRSATDWDVAGAALYSLVGNGPAYKHDLMTFEERERLRQHQPNGFMTVLIAGRPIGFIALLALRDTAASAFVTGTFPKSCLTPRELQPAKDYDAGRHVFVESAFALNRGCGLALRGHWPVLSVLFQSLNMLIARVAPPSPDLNIYIQKSGQLQADVLQLMGFREIGPPATSRFDRRPLLHATLARVQQQFERIGTAGFAKPVAKVNARRYDPARIAALRKRQRGRSKP